MNLAFIHKAALHARKMSPTGLAVVGIAGVVTATVLACRATLKAQPIIDDHKMGMYLAKDMKDTLRVSDNEPFPYNEVVARQYLQTGVQFAKLYAVPFAVGVVSIACITGGHIVLLNRNAALGAALTATEKAFSKYRAAVTEKYGEDAERDIRYNHQVEDVHNTKDGVVEKHHTIDNSRSPYARMFDESNPLWDRNPSYNKSTLIAQQEYATQRLRAHGYLMLNDVYKALGFPKTSAGAVVGWAIGHGDDFVDFGMLDFTSEPRREAFGDGDESSILLDFNVAGSVWDLIDKKEERF